MKAVKLRSPGGLKRLENVIVAFADRCSYIRTERKSLTNIADCCMVNLPMRERPSWWTKNAPLSPCRQRQIHAQTTGPGETMPQKKLKVGIIGANWSLKVHGTAWKMLPDVEVTAVCTAHKETAQAAAQAFGLPKAYWSVEELAADADIDIIDIGSRPAFRYDMVMAALNGGKHVYSALPFAVDASKARAMLDLPRQKGLVGVVDAQFRWVPAGLYMKALIDEGFTGRPLGFNAQLLMPLRNYDGSIFPHCALPGNGIDPYLWLADRNSGGGGWRNFGTHTTLFLTHLLGEVEEAVGVVETGVKEWTLPDGSRLRPTSEDLGCAVLKLKNNGSSGV